MWRSFAAKLLAVGAIFTAVPVLLYMQLQSANHERNQLMLTVVQEQGRLTAEALIPVLEKFKPRNADQLPAALDRLGGKSLNVKILFRPTTAKGVSNFLFVAAYPQIGGEDLKKVQTELETLGILERLPASCEGGEPLALRLNSPAKKEVVTYLAPYRTAAGCWIIVTAQPDEGILEGVIDRPYWQSPEIRVAASVYLLMAILILSILIDAWRDLFRLRTVARAVRSGNRKSSFIEANRVPELAEVAQELDDLVDTLGRSERLLRQATEENAHALKAPLGVISQSVEPLRRAVQGNERARRCLNLIEQSVERLDSVVSAARSMDETIVSLINPPRRPVALSSLLDALAEAYGKVAEEKGCTMKVAIARNLSVTGSDDLVETIAENLLDNALEFAPEHTSVLLTASIQDTFVQISVEDEGPGVPDGDLERIFERHYSSRTGSHHYGIGLWIVRRNAEAMGGRAWARNKAPTGLKVVVELPLRR